MLREAREEEEKKISPGARPSLINTHHPIRLVERKCRNPLIFHRARTVIHNVPIKEIPCLTTWRRAGDRLFNGVVVEIKGHATVRDGKMRRSGVDNWVVVSEIWEEEVAWVWGYVGAVWARLSVAEAGEGECEEWETDYDLSKCSGMRSVF